MEMSANSTFGLALASRIRHKKAQTYDLLKERDIKALKGWQTRTKSGKSLTPAQMAYADGLLRDLISNGAIKRDTKDNDKAICDEILDALGYE